MKLSAAYKFVVVLKILRIPAVNYHTVFIQPPLSRVQAYGTAKILRPLLFLGFRCSQPLPLIPYARMFVTLDVYPLELVPSIFQFTGLGRNAVPHILALYYH